MTDPACHYCDQVAESECATCGRLYCPEHGADVCLRCLAPESAAPHALAYRGSLVALGLASLVAVFLIISPPQDTATVDEARPVATNTAVFQETATPTPQGADPLPTTTLATPTPDAAEEPTPDTDTPGETTYTVQPGDTLSSIAVENDVTIEDIIAANDDIASEDSIILPGQTIIIPAP